MLRNLRYGLGGVALVGLIAYSGVLWSHIHWTMYLLHTETNWFMWKEDEKDIFWSLLLPYGIVLVIELHAMWKVCVILSGSSRKSTVELVTPVSGNAGKRRAMESPATRDDILLVGYCDNVIN